MGARLTIPPVPKSTIVPDYWAIEDKPAQFFDDDEGLLDPSRDAKGGRAVFSSLSSLPPFPHISDHDRDVLLPLSRKAFGAASDFHRISLHRTKEEKQADRLIAAMFRDRRSYARECNARLSSDPVHGRIDATRFLPIRSAKPILDCEVYSRLCRRYGIAHWSPANRTDNRGRNGLDCGLLWCETIPTVGDAEEEREWPDMLSDTAQVVQDGHDDHRDDADGDDGSDVSKGHGTEEYARIVRDITRRGLPTDGHDAPDMDAIASMCADVHEHGFSGGDLWNLDTLVSLWLYPRVRAFRKRHMGYGNEWESDEDYVRYALRPMERGFRYGALTALADVDCWCDAWCVANGLDGVTSDAMSSRISQVVRHAYMLLACELPTMWI